MRRDHLLTHLHGLVQETTRFAHDFTVEQGGRPATDSPAETEVRVPGYHETSRKAWVFASMQLVEVRDCLAGLGALLTGSETVFSLAILGRVALESAGRAAWLLEQGIGPHARAGRVMSEELFAVNQRRKHLNAILARARDEPITAEGARKQMLKADTKQQEIVARAAALNLDPVGPGKASNGKVIAFGDGRPSATTVAGDVLRAAGLPVGEEVYRLLSGSVHAQIGALATHFGSDVDARGVRMATVNATPTQVHNFIGLPLAGWTGAFDRQVRHMGWDDRAWQSWRRHVLRTLALSFPYDETSRR